MIKLYIKVLRIFFIFFYFFLFLRFVAWNQRITHKDKVSSCLCMQPFFLHRGHVGSWLSSATQVETDAHTSVWIKSGRTKLIGTYVCVPRDVTYCIFCFVFVFVFVVFSSCLFTNACWYFLSSIFIVYIGNSSKNYLGFYLYVHNNDCLNYINQTFRRDILVMAIFISDSLLYALNILYSC